MRNKSNLKAFSILGLVMMSFAIIFGWVMYDVFTFNTEFFIIWIYFFTMYLVVKFLGCKIQHATFFFYLWITPLMIMGNILGTFGDPTEPSITIMVFLCVLPLFILDKPWRIVLFIVVHSTIYTICCYYAKTHELFIEDMIDLVLFSVLGIGVNCLILRDRIDNVEYAMEMMLMAETDALTGLDNRGSGEEKIKKLLNKQKTGMFLLIDLDDFKTINDSYGHANGDRALITLASCLRQCIQNSDIAMRLGGDEFAVFVKNVVNYEVGEKLIKQVLKAINNITIEEMPNYQLTVSIGASIVGYGSYKDFNDIYKESDNALYCAKKNGKNTYSIYDYK